MREKMHESVPPTNTCSNSNRKPEYADAKKTIFPLHFNSWKLKYENNIIGFYILEVFNEAHSIHGHRLRHCASLFASAA